MTERRIEGVPDDSLPSVDTALLSVSGLDIEIDGRVLVRDLTFDVPAGSVTCLLGRNGTGKSLTLRTLARLRPPSAGTLRLEGRQLSAWPRLEFARRVGLLAQDSADAFPVTAFEEVLAGRHPHIGFWDWEGDEDRRLARAALAAVAMEGFASRMTSTLSGGERRRVALAAVLAQDPSLLILDEPTNHLDPRHQIGVLGLLRTLTARGKAVVMSLHDAGLAARFADRVLMLFGDGTWLHGPTADILTAANVSRLYETAVRELAWPGGRTFVPVPGPVG